LAVKSRLVDELGRDLFESWFAKVALVQIKDGVVLLRPPTKFLAKWLTDNYADRTLRAWQLEAPGIKAVRFDHCAVTPGAKPEDQPKASEQSGVRAGDKN